MDSVNTKKLARISGVLYLIIIVCAGFSQGAVREVVIVSGDAAATARNILENTNLFNAGLMTDLIAFICDAGVSVLLYLLLKPVGKGLAMTAAAFRLIAHPAIGSLNLLNHFAALKVLESDGFAASFNPSQLQEFSLFFMELHNMGYLIAGAFFGIHCLLLGYLLYQSDLFPKVLGILLAAAAFGYLIESFGFIFFPEMKSTLGLIVGLSAGIGEVTLMLWLVIKGVRH
ncbi:DUF4386 domain-containing protein [Rhodohalobacter mucosus]|uniref:DUF4386 domain-containing protein n=1 Tax=Rhodohalobacter mucosus TaxID=2079485 RepID=A0A316TSJ9_9BACT|nr:DUF4386 domain-containing protein [Rhodohalobacter mucosus]PWN07390.1 DUF4386 domain-containing protein [Rhodohalobacter mucosus]